MQAQYIQCIIRGSSSLGEKIDIGTVNMTD